jgi:hypothetical protein
MFESAIVRCLVTTIPTWKKPERPITIGRSAILPEAQRSSCCRICYSTSMRVARTSVSLAVVDETHCLGKGASRSIRLVLSRGQRSHI